MAPSAESTATLEYANNRGDSIPPHTRVVDQKKTVTFAVNYELSMVDRFLQTTTGVKSVPEPTTPQPGTRLLNRCSLSTTPAADATATIAARPQQEAPGSNPTTTIINLIRRGSNLENSAPNLLHDSQDDEPGKMEWIATNKPLSTPAFHSSNATTTPGVKTRGKRVSIATTPTAPSTTGLKEQGRMEQEDPSQLMRRSSREAKKRESSLVTARVRYDMEAVPYVRRNCEFLKAFPSWPMICKPTLSSEERRSSRFPKDEEPRTTAPVNPVSQQPQATSQSCRPGPFDGSSVVWIPDTRMQWEHSVSEMTAVCTSAALRKHTGEKPFIAPLSKEYIKDRIDIDDPLNGYQIRHQTGGWLQGFILWTNFTTWTHFFHWDSLHPASGVIPQDANPSMCGWDNADIDGSLGQRLEKETRSGDPHGNGIVFESIAEIGLLGGLSCGEYLLRMALDSILQQKQYKFVVLQATTGSRSFYERFGFRRVGAVCRYGKRGKNGIPEYPTLKSPVQGYRHWTHPNESEKSLDLHGGPSYMMCLEIPEDRPVIGYPTSGSQPSFLEEMLKLKVDLKPTVEQIGASSTPAPKKRMKGRNTMATAPNLPSLVPQDTATSSTLPGPALANRATPSIPMPPSMSPIIPSGLSTTTTYNEPLKDVPDKAAAAQSVPRPKRVYSPVENSSLSSSDGPRVKRLRVAELPLAPPPAPSPRESLLTPPSKGEQLSYAQKQYHSVWLAVAPQERQPTRRAPRDRTSLGTPKPGCDTTERRSAQPMAANKAMVYGVAMAPSPRSPNGKTSGLSPKRNVKTSSSTKTTKVAPKSPRRSEKVQTPRLVKSETLVRDDGKTTGMDKSVLVKQKMKSYPRDRDHFYNKVVKLKSSKGEPKYYFVLHYNEPKRTVKLVPMEARGELTGMRQGRPRYQCVLGQKEENFFTASALDCKAVPAFMVMKTPVVAQEAWDISPVV
jgi:hypothetical protein